MNQYLQYSDLNENTQSIDLMNEYQQNKEKLKDKIISESFSKIYPNLFFSDLKKQNNSYSTDDGCIHYKHNKTGQIFSWSFIENEWEEYDDKSQYDLQIYLKDFFD